MIFYLYFNETWLKSTNDIDDKAKKHKKIEDKLIEKLKEDDFCETNL